MTNQDGSQLPQGWLLAELGEIADIQLGKMLDKKRTAGKPLPYLRNINVRWDEIDTTDLLEMPFKESELSRYSLAPGDVLVCEGGEPGRAAVWKTDDSHIKFQKALHRVRGNGAFVPRWLVFHLLHDAQRGALSHYFTGTTIKHFPGESIREYRVRVPPFAEQERVVAALDSLLSRVDNAAAILRNVQRNLLRYRASVLQAAVEGRLVPTEAGLARAEGRDYEPASALLERILAERRRRWEATQRVAKRRSPYKEPLPPRDEPLPALPEGWCWTTLGQLFEVVVGSTPSRATAEFWGGGIPWVSSGEVAFCRIRSTRETISQTGLDGSSARLNPVGSVLLGMIGEGKTRGQAAILDIEAANNQNCAAIWVTETDIPPEYVYFLLMGQYEATRRLGSGNNQPALNKRRVQAIPLPLPPLAEIERIASSLSEHISLIEHLQWQVTTIRARSDRLRQSILKWAFEGKLVDQDPSDEPASVLLERIRAERRSRGSSQAAGRGRRRSGSAGAPRLTAADEVAPT